jgi:hypothetical protein
MAIFEAGRPKCSDSGVGYAYDVLVNLSDSQHINVFPVGGMSEFT